MDLKNLVLSLRQRLATGDFGVRERDVWFYWKGPEAILAVRCRPGFAPAVSMELQKAKVPITCEVKEMEL